MSEHIDSTPNPYVRKPIVVIPTYNEVANIAGIVGRLHAALSYVDVLIVDDSSPDGTGDLAEDLAAVDPRVHVLHRREKSGLGAAYLAGFAWALAGDYDAIVEMDADGSHAPEDLPRLLAALGPDADVCLGSRWVAGGVVLNWPRSRMLLSRGGNTYTRSWLGIDVKDATGGYRAFRRQVLEELDLDSVSSQGYCFQVDLAWRASRAGFSIVEVPITFTERVAGVSKMSSRIIAEALLRVTLWGMARRGRQLLGSGKATPVLHPARSH